MPCCCAACCCLRGQEDRPYMKERYSSAVLLCCVLLSAGERGPSIHDGVSIQICRRYWRGGREKKRPKTTSRVFGFGLFGQPKNRLKNVGFRSGKNEKNRPKKPTSVFGSQPWSYVYLVSTNERLFKTNAMNNYYYYCLLLYARF